MLFLITHHCTMACKHCMSNSTPDSPHASKKTVDAFIKFARKTGTFKIGISGGEPTSHPDFLYHFSRILKEFPKAIIQLMSNGQFFKDRNLVMALSHIQRMHPFHIQICSIKGLYREYDQILPLYREYSPYFSNIYMINSLNTMEKQLGRAKHNNIEEFNPNKPRAASGCFNLYNISRNRNSFKEVLHLLDTQTDFNFCKPMIDCHGNIHPGESPDCKIIGNIHDITLGKIHKTLSTTDPCGKCGNPIRLQDVLLHDNCRIKQIQK